MRENVLTPYSINNFDFDINNPISVDWSKFMWTKEITKHMLTEEEIYRFYLVPEFYYDNTGYEDILLILNNITNIFDLLPGTYINIPSKDNIDNFLKGLVND